MLQDVPELPQVLRLAGLRVGGRRARQLPFGRHSGREAPGAGPGGPRLPACPPPAGRLSSEPAKARPFPPRGAVGRAELDATASSLPPFLPSPSLPAGPRPSPCSGALSAAASRRPCGDGGAAAAVWAPPGHTGGGGLERSGRAVRRPTAALRRVSGVRSFAALISFRASGWRCPAAALSGPARGLSPGRRAVPTTRAKSGLQTTPVFTRSAPGVVPKSPTWCPLENF